MQRARRTGPRGLTVAAGPALLPTSPQRVKSASERSRAATTGGRRGSFLVRDRSRGRGVASWATQALLVPTSSRPRFSLTHRLSRPPRAVYDITRRETFENMSEVWLREARQPDAPAPHEVELLCLCRLTTCARVSSDPPCRTVFDSRPRAARWTCTAQCRTASRL